MENLISKWENPSLVELHRLARTEMERLNHAKNATSQRVNICESRKTPLIRKKHKTSFQKAKIYSLMKAKRGW